LFIIHAAKLPNYFVIVKFMLYFCMTKEKEHTMNYLKTVLLVIFCLLPAFSISSSADGKVPFPEGKCYLYRLTLKDKKGTAFSLRHPEAFLSQKAIERRKRQHIAIDSTDLPVSQEYVKALETRGLQVVMKSKWNNTVVVRCNHSANVFGLDALPFVSKMTEVYVAPDSIGIPSRQEMIKPASIPDSLKKSVYGKALKQVEMMNGVKLHEAGFRGEGMTIAIIDGGFMNADSIPLINNVKIADTRDFGFPRSSNFYGETDHGVCVLSLMGANQPYRLMGTAPSATYVLLRSEVQCSEQRSEEDSWAEAAEYADSLGVDVINSSLGYNKFDDAATNVKYRELDGHASLVSNTASMLADKGIILVNSAGNDGDNDWKKITIPADADHILTVGALSASGVNASFSSVGPSADGRVKPEIMAMGNPAYVIKGNGLVSMGSGTSFASPLACGMVACLWQALPDKTANEIIELVCRCSNQYATPDNIFGYGTPDFWKAYEMGQGKKNIE
jgi:serine protease AprX